MMREEGGAKVEQQQPQKKPRKSGWDQPLAAAGGSTPASPAQAPLSVRAPVLTGVAPREDTAKTPLVATLAANSTTLTSTPAPPPANTSFRAPLSPQECARREKLKEQRRVQARLKIQREDMERAL